MNVAKLNDFLSIIANVGVLIGLVFLILELNQSNRIAIAASEAEIRSTLIAPGYSILENPELIELLSKLQRNDPIDDSELTAAAVIVGMRFSTWAGVVEQYNMGVFSDNTLNNYTEDMKTFFKNTPGALPFLAVIRENYNIQSGENPLYDVFLAELSARGY